MTSSSNTTGVRNQQPTTFTGQSIKYLYLHDPKNPNRVITVARTVDHDVNEIRYAFAVTEPHDRFVKKLGRQIADGRLVSMNAQDRSSSFSDVLALENDRPITAILKRLAHDHRIVIRRTAEEALRLHSGPILENA
jgi:hypothetical protein